MHSLVFHLLCPWIILYLKIELDRLSFYSLLFYLRSRYSIFEFLNLVYKSPTQRQNGQSVEIIEKAPSETPFTEKVASETTITEKAPTDTPIENTTNQKIKITVKKKHTLKKKNNTNW